MSHALTQSNRIRGDSIRRSPEMSPTESPQFSRIRKAPKPSRSRSIIDSSKIERNIGSKGIINSGIKIEDADSIPASERAGRRRGSIPSDDGHTISGGRRINAIGIGKIINSAKGTYGKEDNGRISSAGKHTGKEKTTQRRETAGRCIQ